MPRSPSDPKTLDAVAAYLTELFRGGTLTQRELEKRSGVSQTNISDAKNAKKATDETVAKIARAMNVSSDDILSGAALVELRRGRSAEPSPTRSVVPDPGQARTTDALFWVDFARQQPAFDDLAEATKARAAKEGWTEEETNRILNIAAKHAGRSYGGGSVSHADARHAVARGVAIVIEQRDPDDVPALAKLLESASVATLPPTTKTLAEALAEKPKKKPRR